MPSIPSGTSRRHDPTTPEGRAHLARVRDEERDRARLLRHVGWAPGSDAVTLHERVHGCRYGVNATRRHLRELADEGQVEERDGGWHILNGGRHASAGQLPAPGSVDTPPDPNPGQADRSAESLAAPASPAQPAPQEAARPDASEAACVSESVGVPPPATGSAHDRAREAVLWYVTREPGRWTVAEIAEAAGLGRTTVQFAVAWLRADGLLLEAYRDVRATRTAYPGTPSKVSHRAGFGLWEVLRRADRPWTTQELCVAVDARPDRVSRCISKWRKRGAVSKRGGLWPGEASDVA